jgi:putative transposase
MQMSSSSVYNINYHFVWCTKYRKNILIGPIAEQLETIIRTICASNGWDVKQLSIQPDHIHLFISTFPYNNPTGIIKIFKGVSARQLKKIHPNSKHLWSPSYYVGTAGYVSAQTIQKYIQNQSGGTRNSSTV